jgi:hypothetical protein
MHPPRNCYAYQQVAIQALRYSVIGLGISCEQRTCLSKAGTFAFWTWCFRYGSVARWTSLRTEDLVTLRPERDDGHKGTLPKLAPGGFPQYPDLRSQPNALTESSAEQDNNPPLLALNMNEHASCTRSPSSLEVCQDWSWALCYAALQRFLQTWQRCGPLPIDTRDAICRGYLFSIIRWKVSCLGPAVSWRCGA